MQNKSDYKKGDRVRLTSIHSPDTSIIGHIVEAWKMGDCYDIKVTFLGKYLSINTRDIDIELIARAEPKELGAVHTQDDETWVRYSDNGNFPWIRTDGLGGRWKNDGIVSR